MSHVVEMTGRRYGRLVVRKRVGSTMGNLPRATWKCQCDCGRIVTVVGYALRTGNTTSCGCSRLQLDARRLWMLHPKEYKSWAAMIQRCTNPNNEDFKNYGGRGIKVAIRWRSFFNFFNDMGSAPIGHSLERRNVNGHYHLLNCRWANPTDQARNTRRNRFYTFQGRTFCISQWAEELGMKAHLLRRRLDRGETFERAISRKSRDNHGD